MFCDFFGELRNADKIHRELRLACIGSRQHQQTIDKQRLIVDLISLGLGPGDTVLFHSSLKSIGWVEPGPQAVVAASVTVLLLDTILTKLILGTAK